jgi:hypothetical protein
MAEEPKGVPLCRKMTMEEFREGYVDAHYPGLTGYGYQAEMISERRAMQVMEKILKDVVWIERCVNMHPVLHMKDGKELYVQDTDDFPTPTSEEW